MENAKRIVIDDGTREIPIYNQFDEEICRIRIRPADISIMDRFDALRDDLEDTLAPLEGIGINADGTAAETDGWQTLKAVEAGLIEKLNVVLDTNDAGAIFAKRNAFSSVGGQFFCEIVIAALGELIANAIAEESEKTQQKISKYLPTGDETNAGATANDPDGVREITPNQV